MLPPFLSLPGSTRSNANATSSFASENLLAIMPTFGASGLDATGFLSEGLALRSTRIGFEAGQEFAGYQSCHSGTPCRGGPGNDEHLHLQYARSPGFMGSRTSRAQPALRNDRNFVFLPSPLRRSIALIESSKLVQALEHPNAESYPNQLLYEVGVDRYVHVAPVVRRSRVLFLKTIYSSRKARLTTRS